MEISDCAIPVSTQQVFWKIIFRLVEHRMPSLDLVPITALIYFCKLDIMGTGRRAVCFSFVIIASVLAVSQIVNFPLAEASIGQEISQPSLMQLFVAGLQPTAFSIMGILAIVGAGAFGVLYYSCNKNN